jgi:hypothetical protein
MDKGFLEISGNNPQYIVEMIAELWAENKKLASEVILLKNQKQLLMNEREELINRITIDEAATVIPGKIIGNPFG